MTEEEAKQRLGVPRETLQRLTDFVELLKRENLRQNLVSQASLDHVWARHILDSAQLMRFAPANAAKWLDLGSGPGFPGLILALLTGCSTTLVESRKLRAEFLGRAASRLGVDAHTHVICGKVETVPTAAYDVITARAFAPLPKLLALAERFAAPSTRWILPKGRNAKSELEAVESLWQGEFRLEPSLTDPAAQIIVGEQVQRRHKGTARQ